MKMKYDDFIERIVEEIKPLLPEEVEKVSSMPVRKNNEVELTGLVVQDKSNISPVIYLTPYFYQYLDGRSFEAILADVAGQYSKYRQTENFDVQKIMSWDSVKSNVIRKLVNYGMNKNMLEQMPYVREEDFAVVYQVIVSDMDKDQEYSSVTVKHEYMDTWGVTLEELNDAALNNTRRILPARLDNLADVFAQLEDISLPFLEEMNIHILTNNKKVYGAVHVLDPVVMEYIKEKVGEDVYYVIPSSVHEVLLIPYNEDYECSTLEEMIREVNQTQLQDVEVLSNKAYVMDTVEKKLLLASKYESYRKELELKEKQEKMSKDWTEPEQNPKL